MAIKKFVDDVMNTLRDAVSFSGRNRRKKLDKAIEEADPRKKKKTSMLKRKVRTLRS